jgi:hypothetical protein
LKTSGLIPLGKDLLKSELHACKSNKSSQDAPPLVDIHAQISRGFGLFPHLSQKMLKFSLNWPLLPQMR